MVWSFNYDCRIVVASVYTILNYLVMLRLTRIITIVVVVLIIVILNNGTIVSSESPPHFCSYSSKTSRCPGDHDHVKIRAPLWIENRTTDEAGDCINYPGFQVKCAANGRPVINVSNNLFYVLSTDLLNEYGGGGLLRVVDVDIDAQECPQPRRNISFEESTRFFTSYPDYKVNITFFYNCRGYPEKVVQHVPCLYNSSRGPSFAFLDREISTHQFDWYGNCEDAVLLSNWPFIDYPDTEDYTETLKSGFDLQWSYPVNCWNCELSGGKCWANETNITTTTPFHCNCTDGTTMVDDICPGLVVLVAPTLAPSTSPSADSPMYYTADSPAGDSPMYYRSFDNGTMRRKMWMRNMKIKLIVLGIIIALILIIVMSICKGFNC